MKFYFSGKLYTLYKQLYNYINQEYNNFILWTPIIFAIAAYVAIYGPILSNRILVIMTILAVIINIWQKTRNILLNGIIIFCVAYLYTNHFIGGLNDGYHNNNKINTNQSSVINIKGTVAKIVKSDVRSKIILRNIDQANNLNIRWRIVTVNVHMPDALHAGDVIEVKVKTIPTRPSVIIGGPDFRLYDMHKKIMQTAYTITPIKVLSHKNSDSRLEQLRDYIKNQFFSYDKSGKISGIATALVTGDKDNIDPDIRQDYISAGIAHILAISGLHMAMVAGIIFFLIRLLLVLPRLWNLNHNTKKYAAFLTIIAITGYMMLCWESVSARRAYLMTVWIMIGVIADRNFLSLYNILLAALVVMLINPLSVATIGFHLSFGAVIALIAAYEYIEQSLQRFKFSYRLKDRAVYIFSNMFTSTLVATFATSIFTMYHFKQFSLYGLLTNIVAIPYFSFFIMPMIMIWLLFLVIGQEFLITPLLYWGLEQMQAIAQVIAQLPYGGMIYITQSAAIYVIIGAAGLLWLCIWKQSWRHAGWPAIMVAYCAMIIFDDSPDIYFSHNHRYMGYHDKNNKILHIVGRSNNKFITSMWQQNAGMPKVIHHHRDVEEFLANNPDLIDITKVEESLPDQPISIFLATHGSNKKKVGVDNDEVHTGNDKGRGKWQIKRVAIS